MPRKQKTEETKPEVPKIVTVAIRREHCLTPHSIELRKNSDGLVIDARTENWEHTYTIGAKTVETLLRESGGAVPDTEQIELIIKISPNTGEIISVEPKPSEDHPEIETDKSEDQSEDQ